MFETPDQYVMETYHLYIKNHIYSFPNNIKTMNKCVCVHGRAKVSWVSWAPGHPDILCKNRPSKSQMLISSETNLTDWNIPTDVLSPPSVIHI